MVRRRTYFTIYKNIDQTFKVLLKINIYFRHNKFDGMIFSCNLIWQFENLYTLFQTFIQKLYEAIKKENMSLILTILPYTENFINQLSRSKFQEISQYTDYFNIMTSDYVRYNESEEKTKDTQLLISPLPWILKSLEYYVGSTNQNKNDLFNKIFLEIPFSGIIGGKAGQKKGVVDIDSQDLLNIINTHPVNKFEWDETQGEHLLEIGVKNKDPTVAFPTKRFIRERLKLSQEKNLAGVSLSDISMGLESFFDEL